MQRILYASDHKENCRVAMEFVESIEEVKSLGEFEYEQPVKSCHESSLVYVDPHQFGTEALNEIHREKLTRVGILSDDSFYEALLPTVEAAQESGYLPKDLEIRRIAYPEKENKHTFDNDLVNDIRRYDHQLILAPGAIGTRHDMLCLRFIVHEGGFNGKIFVALESKADDASSEDSSTSSSPQDSENTSYTWPRKPFEYGGPFGLYLYASSASSRVMHPFTYLFRDILGWKYDEFRPVCYNGRSTLALRDKGKSTHPEDVSRAYYWQMRDTEYRELRHIHMPVRLEPILEAGVPFLVLLRDPRDIFASIYFRKHGEERRPARERAKILMDIMMGGYAIGGIWSIQYVSLPDMVQNFLDALESPICEFIRFDALQEDTIAEFKRVLSWMGVYPHPLVRVNDDVLAEMEFRTTFEYLSGGTRTRGDISSFHKTKVKKETRTSIRKGVSGDWVRCFTPEIVDVFKKYSNNAMSRLGFEENEDWELPEEWAKD